MILENLFILFDACYGYFPAPLFERHQTWANLSCHNGGSSTCIEVGMVFRLFGPFWSLSYRCKVLAFWFCEIWGFTEGYNLSIFNNSAKSEANCSLLKPPYGGGLQNDQTPSWVAQSSACQGPGLNSNPSTINFKRCAFYAFNSLWIWEHIKDKNWFG